MSQLHHCNSYNLFLSFKVVYNNYKTIAHSGKKKVARIRRISSHMVAELSAFGIEQGNPFRDCIDSLLIDWEW